MLLEEVEVPALAIEQGVENEWDGGTDAGCWRLLASAS
jgi:hypothetical protein